MSQRRHCGKAIEAQPSLRPDRVRDRVVACQTACRESHASVGPRRSGVAERHITKLARGKTPRIPEPCLAEKCSLQRCSVRRYRRGLSHRRGNSAFTASLTAGTAGHHSTDNEADAYAAAVDPPDAELCGTLRWVVHLPAIAPASSVNRRAAEPCRGAWRAPGRADPRFAR
jgi:hypothetical protein